MHFVGMLAARLPFPTDYLVFPTLLSFLVCVIVVGAAVFAVSAGPLTPARLAVSSLAMGIGIASMHYIGMAALHASAHLEHATVFVVASVVVGIAASGLALWLAGGGKGRPPLLLSATAFGLAIAGMHYTAMAGLTVFPHADAVVSGPALSTDLLAIVVAVVAFLVSGVFLLILVPDRSSAPATAPVSAPNAESDPPPAPAAAALTSLGQGTYSPLGGAGGPPRRTARQLPVERGGATIFLPVEEIVAVHANAHYTYVFDGKSQLFCQLSIGEVQSRLDASQFLRVHRSHIVNLDRIAGLKRAGDQGIVELAAQGSHTVPVSRNRFNWLKSQLGLKLGQAAQ